MIEPHPMFVLMAGLVAIAAGALIAGVWCVWIVLKWCDWGIITGA